MEFTQSAIFGFGAPGPRLRDPRLGRELQEGGAAGQRGEVSTRDSSPTALLTAFYETRKRK